MKAGAGLAAVVLLVVGWYFGVDISGFVDTGQGGISTNQIAHHVQNELGILGQANRIRTQVSETETNAISVPIELQADCYSGIWAQRQRWFARGFESGNLESCDTFSAAQL